MRKRLKPMAPEALQRVAEKFKVLAEPARLQILNELGLDELSVSDLMSRTGLNQANLSRHLQLLWSSHFVSRRKEGLYVYYRVADPDVYTLCDLMCGRIDRELKLLQAQVRGRDPSRG